MGAKRAVFLIAAGVAVSACGDKSVEQPIPMDVTPPSPVRSLNARVTESGRVLLTWTAVGDDADEGQAQSYSLRYSRAPLLPALWDSADAITGVSPPQQAGRLESLSILNPGYGDWSYGLRVADEAGNVSDISNIANLSIVDRTAPSRISDLALESTAIGVVSLRWTATGNDENAGTATEYDLRTASVPITEESWGTASRIEGAPAPQVAGSSETFLVTGIDPRAIAALRF